MNRDPVRLCLCAENLLAAVQHALTRGHVTDSMDAVALALYHDDVLEALRELGAGEGHESMQERVGRRPVTLSVSGVGAR